MSTVTRREQYIQAAVKVFSEGGFGATTRLVARKLGVTQSLLFRYFPRKELLIQAVLEQLLLRHSTADWIGTLSDRTRPLRERLIEFSLEYMDKVYGRDWLRIYMFSGLAHGAFTWRYVANVTEPLLKTIATEIRNELGVDERSGSAVTLPELEYLWLFRGGLYYQAVRRYIYGLYADDEALKDSVSISVDSLLWGMSKLLDVRAPAV